MNYSEKKVEQMGRLCKDESLDQNKLGIAMHNLMYIDCAECEDIYYNIHNNDDIHKLLMTELKAVCISETISGRDKLFMTHFIFMGLLDEQLDDKIQDQLYDIREFSQEEYYNDDEDDKEYTHAMIVG